jgi:hypothetical protein
MNSHLLPTCVLIIGILFSCNSQVDTTKSTEEFEKPYWTIEKAKKLADDFNTTNKWNMETLNMEVENLSKNSRSDYPLFLSPFPTPEYNSPGNGNGPIEIMIGGKKIIGHNVIIAQGEHSKHLFENPDDKFVTYFTILTIADGKNIDNPVLATSRNHPHYLSQGSLNTSTKSRVDWVAVQLADKNAYAIVNTRLFDLRVGRIILAAPQKDGSIRFYQTNKKPMNALEREEYIVKLKADKKAVEFFTQPGNI